MFQVYLKLIQSSEIYKFLLISRIAPHSRTIAGKNVRHLFQGLDKDLANPAPILPMISGGCVHLYDCCCSVFEDYMNFEQYICIIHLIHIVFSYLGKQFYVVQSARMNDISRQVASQFVKKRKTYHSHKQACAGHAF